MKHEQATAIEEGVPWDMRGPRGPADDGPRVWKGQKFREGSQRWANGGGRKKQQYVQYYRQLKIGLTGEELWFHHPKNTEGRWREELDAEKLAAAELAHAEL